MSVDLEAIIIELEENLIYTLNSSDITNIDYKWQKSAYIDRAGKLKIYINPNEHNPPHFHVECQPFNASFTIKDCSILKGKISKSDYRKLKNWYLKYKELLIYSWNETRPTNYSVRQYIE